MKENIDELFSKRDIKQETIKYVGRSASASTATGLMANHKAQLENIFKRVFVSNIKKEIK